jgi:hypothetical protein
VTEIAVLHPEEFIGGGHQNLPSAIQGITRMLEEGGHQFDVVDSASDLGDYEVVVLPDYITASPTLVERLEAYLASGGALIASFASGLDATESEFSLKSLGIRLQGEGVRDLEGHLVRGRYYSHHDFCDYVLPKEEIAKGLRKTEHAMYMKGMEVAAEPGSEVLADTVLPYFDRTYRHFCSHRQTPSSGRIGNPAIVRNGRTIYFSHPIFSQYERNAPRWLFRDQAEDGGPIGRQSRSLYRGASCLAAQPWFWCWSWWLLQTVL